MLTDVSTTDDLTARVNRLESILEISRLSANYCRGADRRDLDLFLSVWAPDAVWAPRDNVVYTGIDQIAEAIEMQWRSVKRARHRTSNAAIEADGDFATGRFDVEAEIELPDGSWVAAAGQYSDIFRRSNGRWLISERQVVIDWEYPLVRPPK